MSNAGGSRIRGGAVTGTVIGQIPMGRQTDFDDVDFESEAIWDDAIKAATGVVKTVVGAGTGAISSATRTAGGIATTAVKSVSGAVSGGASVAKAVQKEAVKIATTMPKIEVPKISVPKIEVPKIDIPKISVSVPKVEVPKVDVSGVTKAVAGVAALTAGGLGVATIAMPEAMNSALKSINVPILSVTAPITGTPKITDTKDLVEGIKCGIFGCGDQQGALESVKQAGEAALNVLNLPGTIVKGVTGVAAKAGSDVLKDLPDLTQIQKATQSLGTTAFIVGISNPLTAPATIVLGIGNYAQTLLGGKAGSDSKTDAAIKAAVDKANAEIEVPELTTGLEEREVMKPLPGPMYSTDVYFRPGEEFQYGEDRTDVATCTVRRGEYIGFVKKYKYTESLPNECVPEGAVKYYTSLGNYKQKEMVGIPQYTEDGRIDMYDPDTGVLIQEINQEELASGTVSINKPETSLVYQSWATEPAVGADYDKEEANRYAITEFRDANSDDLEAQVDKLNATEDGDYLMVDYSRLGAELYGGKVLPIDGRVLDPSLVTQETDYGKKIGLDYPVNNVKKVYGDLGQSALGEVMAPKIVAASNAKGALSSLSEKATKGPTVAVGTITNGFVQKPKTECAEGDIICGIGKTLNVINPNAICADNSTNIMCQGLRGVENTVLQVAEGVGGAVPSIADIAYDTTTGAVEKLRGLDEGSLKRLGMRQSWDNMFEKATVDVVGIDLDKQYFTKSLGLDKVKQGDLGGALAAGSVGIFEDFLSHPVEWLTPGVIEAEFVLQAPSIGESVASLVTGTPRAEVKYSYVINNETGELEEVVEETVPQESVVDVVVYTNDPAMDGKVVYSDAPLTGAVV